MPLIIILTGLFVLFMLGLWIGGQVRIVGRKVDALAERVAAIQTTLSPRAEPGEQVKP